MLPQHADVAAQLHRSRRLSKGTEPITPHIRPNTPSKCHPGGPSLRLKPAAAGCRWGLEAEHEIRGVMPAVVKAQSRFRRHVIPRRAEIQMVVDAASWALAIVFFALARFDFAVASFPGRGVLLLAPLAALIQVGAGLAQQLYRGRYQFGSFEEVAGVAAAATVTGCLVLAVDAISARTHLLPVSVLLGAGTAAVMSMLGFRYVWRTRIDRRRRPRVEHSERLLVFGAGEGGEQVVRAMLREPLSPYYPVGLLDDDPTKQNLRILGVPVVGTRASLVEAADTAGVRTLLIAMPSADGAILRELTKLAEGAGLAVKVLPTVGELFGNPVGLRDIRDLDMADLLGRRQVETDLDSIAGYLTGRRVLITGAGGSIGSELCQQVARYAPAELMMLDRDESGLHAVQLSLTGRALLDSPDVILADIRDVEHVNRIFEQRRPVRDSCTACSPDSSRSSIINSAGAYRATWRHSSEPMEPPAPVTSTRLPVR